MASLRSLVALFVGLLQLLINVNGSLEPEGDPNYCYQGKKGCDAAGSRSFGDELIGFAAGACASGTKQSPIDFPKPPPNPSKLKLNLSPQYFEPHNFRITNLLGHTLQGDIQNGSEILIAKGDLMDHETYLLDSFHFHWGSKDQGSEHTVEGKTLAAELHLVHYNTKYFDKVAALDSKDPHALAVIGVLFQLGPKDNPYLEPILSLAKEVKTPHAVAKGRGLNFYKLISNGGDTRGVFGHYSGSLTTPGCDEVVLWNVRVTPLPISAKQLDALRSLEDSNGTPLADNYRAPQPLNGRNIEYFRVQMSKNEHKKKKKKSSSPSKASQVHRH